MRASGRTGQAFSATVPYRRQGIRDGHIPTLLRATCAARPEGLEPPTTVFVPDGRQGSPIRKSCRKSSLDGAGGGSRIRVRALLLADDDRAAADLEPRPAR